MAHKAKPQEVTLKNGTSVVLRPLRKNDLGALVRFADSLYKERLRNPDLGIVSLDRPVTVTKESEFLERTIKDRKKGNGVGVAAFCGDEMVGNCDINRRTAYDIAHTGVLGIAIAEGYRGAGLGRELMERVLSEARDMGIWLVELTVFKTNARALRLYTNTGFKRVGVIPDKIQRRGRFVDECIMYVDLRETKEGTNRRRSREESA